MVQFQLSATLKGHTQDVKDLTIIDNERLASVSRDGTVRLWTMSSDSNGHESNQNKWEDTILSSSSKFLNSICYDDKQQIVYFAGNENIINGKSILATLGGDNEDPLYTLIGHEGNICSLNLVEDELISCSWDKTAKVWSNGGCKWNLTGHNASVWDGKILPGNKNHFITVSADKIVRIWENDTEIKTLYGIHDDVIRHVEILNDKGTLFATCSNDTTIKIFDFQGTIKKTLSGHESFVYQIKYNPSTNELISCGEDRSIRIWDLTTFEVKQVIRLPAVSLWCCDFLPNGDIVVAGSDKLIRIFTRDQTRIAPQADIESLQKEVESTALNSRTIDFDESKLSPYNILQSQGKKEGQVVVVKAPNGVIEAHQYSNGSWMKVGDVVSSTTSASDQKTEFEGQMFDYVFDVDIKEGEPPLKLALNVTDNPYEVADKFLMKYDLPSSYREQIVEFIIKNASGVTLGELDTAPTQGNNNNNFKQDIKPMKVLPSKTYLTMKKYKSESIFNGIVKFNSSTTIFNDEDLALIGTALDDVDTHFELLYDIANKIKDQWENKLPAFDIIRLIVHKLPASTNISAYIEEGLNNENINITMMAVRILVNCFQNKSWGIQLMSSPDVYSSIFETIGTLFQDATLSQSQMLAISVATLLMNYSSLVVQEGSHSKYLDIVPIIAEAINNKYGVLEEYQTSEEAAYRLVIAYGNLSTVEPTLKQFAKSISWLNQVKRRYINNGRFHDVFEDLELI